MGVLDSTMCCTCNKRFSQKRAFLFPVSSFLAVHRERDTQRERLGISELSTRKRFLGYFYQTGWTPWNTHYKHMALWSRLLSRLQVWSADLDWRYNVDKLSVCLSVWWYSWLPIFNGVENDLLRLSISKEPCWWYQWFSPSREFADRVTGLCVVITTHGGILLGGWTSNTLHQLITPPSNPTFFFHTCWICNHRCTACWNWFNNHKSFGSLKIIQSG